MADAHVCGPRSQCLKRIFYAGFLQTLYTVLAATLGRRQNGDPMKKCLAFLAFAALNVLAQSLPEASSAATVKLIALASPHAGLVSAPQPCNKPAAIVGDAYADMPAIASMQGVTGTTRVRIDLTFAGNLSGIALFDSSGNPWLDRAAVSSAESARFTPEIANCEPVGGSYLYEVDFL